MSIRNLRPGALHVITVALALPLLVGADGGCQDDGDQTLDEAPAVDSGSDPLLGIFGFSHEDYFAVHGCEGSMALASGSQVYTYCSGDMFLTVDFDDQGMTMAAEVGVISELLSTDALELFAVDHMLPPDAELLGEVESAETERLVDDRHEYFLTQTYTSEVLAEATDGDGYIDIFYAGWDAESIANMKVSREAP